MLYKICMIYYNDTWGILQEFVLEQEEICAELHDVSGGKIEKQYKLF